TEQQNNRTTEQQNNRTTEQQNNRTLSEKFNILLRAMNSSVQERFSPLVLVRLLLPSLFPQYDKLITCDVDIVFANDMSESYFALNTDDSHYLAVVKDLKSGSSVTDMIKIYLETAASQKMNIHKHFFSPEQWQILHKNSLNIGFAVFNLKAWRKDRIEEQCIEFFAHKGHGLCFPEQDTLTLLCYKHILELPYIYNTHPFYLDIPHHPVHQIIQNVEEVIVWHFYGQEKPWDPQNLYKCQNSLNAIFTYLRRKAPSFSYGDIRRILCYNVFRRVGASTLGVEVVRPACGRTLMIPESPNFSYGRVCQAYGGAADAIVNLIATQPFAFGLIGGIQLAGNTWTYTGNGFSHTGFQFLFNAGGRIRFKEHIAIQTGIKFPMIPQKMKAEEVSEIRRYVWYVNLVYTF
ncbi:glycosyltransferase, partial [Helicobacter salomonis]|uniref:glycosyltransferase n=1 Tax=Helicobacter salomonis TaxID=56878 RepID=UPI0013159FB9